MADLRLRILLDDDSEPVGFMKIVEDIMIGDTIVESPMTTSIKSIDGDEFDALVPQACSVSAVPVTSRFLELL